MLVLATSYCPSCVKDKPVAEFSRNRQTSDGWHAYCKVCTKTKAATYYAANTAKVKESQRWKALKHRRGISKAQFDQMVVDQNGVCAICDRGQTDSRGARLVVDHDHQTGRIRGLLCTPCNLAIGYMADNEQRLLAAVAYLRS